MINENKLYEKANKEKENRRLVLDAETAAIIDAQCEEHKTSREKFIAVVTRLFLDFSYIARTVGKDVFLFRDEMIKAIVRSKGVALKENESGIENGKIKERQNSEGSKKNKNDDDYGMKIIDSVKSENEKNSAVRAEHSSVQPMIMSEKNHEMKKLIDKFEGMTDELSALKAAFLELKNILANSRPSFSDNKKRRVEDRDELRCRRESDKHKNAAERESCDGRAEITIDKLADEFKNSSPPSYKDKRKKLHKLKF